MNIVLLVHGGSVMFIHELLIRTSSLSSDLPYGSPQANTKGRFPSAPYFKIQPHTETQRHAPCPASPRTHPPWSAARPGSSPGSPPAKTRLSLGDGEVEGYGGGGTRLRPAWPRKEQTTKTKRRWDDATAPRNK